MVLFHQRTGSSLSESALSARLQYGSATLVLAVPLSLAISMERLLSRDCAAPLQTGRPRRTGTPPRALLDRLSLDLFHFLDNPRILFHALLPCARAAAGFGHGHWRRMDSPWSPPLRASRYLLPFEISRRPVISPMLSAATPMSIPSPWVICWTSRLTPSRISVYLSWWPPLRSWPERWAHFAG